MAKYSKSSQQKLETCHQDLRKIFEQVIKGHDNTIVFGRRTEDEQFTLYKKGRKLAGDAWVIADKSKVVTYKDGHWKKSKHQPPKGSTLSLAIDALSYHKEVPHLRWYEMKSLHRFAGYVLGIADMLKSYGEIEHTLEWGGDWKSFFDGAHFQLKK